jgi:hypothetical protein
MSAFRVAFYWRDILPASVLPLTITAFYVRIYSDKFVAASFSLPWLQGWMLVTFDDLVSLWYSEATWEPCRTNIFKQNWIIFTSTWWMIHLKQFLVSSFLPTHKRPATSTTFHPIPLRSCMVAWNLFYAWTVISFYHHFLTWSSLQ